ncbi:DUF393 domain-containing protein [Aquimarina sp. U1-2]|uniref:thiol-disulfide oxidoreductase DCC family protein n=1 Tax=Aquimarina sp. U1-2 TaxID=2823141 RepID=UPI001AEC99E7|nr:DUF393 domain-containing protein [Aquimarina sp. U1-2]MBP2833553.1 DUF393 domain-containing protein [Aquimarina sp. U1-2]
MVEEGKKIILFDGVCNLCDSAINFVIKHDKNDVFRYASLQSDIGKKLISERSIDSATIDSIILIDPKLAYYHKSTAALQITKQLSGIYPVFSVFLIVPKTIRDWVYDFVAKNRYKWFGKKESCMIPTPELKALFIDQ